MELFCLLTLEQPAGHLTIPAQPHPTSPSPSLPALHI